MSDENPILDPMNGESPRFTEEQLQDFRLWFDEHAEPLLIVNDDPPINVITVPLFRQFLSLRKFHTRDFRYPTKIEVIDDLGKMRNKKFMTKEIFLYMLDKYVKVADLKHELNLAFEVFDIEKNSYLDIDELKTMVTTYDERLDPIELKEFLRDANVKGTGIVNYKEFIERMFATCPELIDLEAKFLYVNPDDDPSVEPLPPGQEESDIMVKLINEEGLTEDNTIAAMEKNNSDINKLGKAISEAGTEFKQSNDDLPLEDKSVQAKSGPSKPAKSDGIVTFYEDNCDRPDTSTVAKSDYSDMTTEVTRISEK